jgi:hypothetical protein
MATVQLACGVGYFVRQEVNAIATERIDTVIGRLARDKAFRMKYCQDPDRALESHLSPEEIRAIKTGDGHRLSLLGAGESWEAFTREMCGQNPAD